jgi:hypothetical protein
MSVDAATVRARLRTNVLVATSLHSEVRRRLEKIALARVDLPEGSVMWGSAEAHAWLQRLRETGTLADFYSGTDTLTPAERALVVTTRAMIDELL